MKRALTTIVALAALSLSAPAKAEETVEPRCSVAAGIGIASKYVTPQGLPTDNDPSLQPWIYGGCATGKGTASFTFWGNYDPFVNREWTDKGFLLDYERPLFQGRKNSITGALGAHYWDTDIQDGDFRARVAPKELTGTLTWARGKNALSATAAHDYFSGGEWIEAGVSRNLVDTDKFTLDGSATRIQYDDYLFGMDGDRGTNYKVMGTYKGKKVTYTMTTSHFVTNEPTNFNNQTTVGFDVSKGF